MPNKPSTAERLANASDEQLDRLSQRNLGLSDKRLIQAEMKRRTEASTQPPAPAQAAAPAQQQGFMDNLGTFADNAKTSGINFVQDTLSGIGDQAKFVSNIFLDNPEAQRQARGYMDSFSQMGDYLGDRYGSVGNFGSTLYNDPVGAAADIGAAGALVMTGGKALGPLAARAGTVPTVAAKAIEQGGRALSNLDPITGLTTAGQVALAPSNVARFMGSEYSKGSDIRNVDDLQDTINDAVEAGYTPDVEGRELWKADKARAAADVETAIELADADIMSGARQSPFTAERLRENVRRFEPEVTADRAAWDRGTEELMAVFESELKRLDRGDMTPSQMRMFRQSLDASITEATRNKTGTAINPKVRDAFANATRDLLNTEFPDLGLANARFKGFKDIQDTMEKTGMSNITDFKRVELSANMAVDAARRLVTGESKVARARGYQALRTGDYEGYLFDHSGAKSLMTLPRQQGALEERLDRSRQYTVGILED
jgi:hypothetical protein